MYVWCAWLLSCMWYVCLPICVNMYVSVYVCMCNGWVSGVFLSSLSTLLIETKSLTKTEAWQFGCSVKLAWPGNPICLSNPGVTGGLQYTSYFNLGCGISKLYSSCLHRKYFIPWATSSAPAAHFHHFNELHTCLCILHPQPLFICESDETWVTTN